MAVRRGVATKSDAGLKIIGKNRARRENYTGFMRTAILSLFTTFILCTQKLQAQEESPLSTPLLLSLATRNTSPSFLFFFRLFL